MLFIKDLNNFKCFFFFFSEVPGRKNYIAIAYKLNISNDFRNRNVMLKNTME